MTINCLHLAILSAAACCAAASSAAHAQAYDISWHVIAGGGGTSTGGTFSLSGTIGQAVAGGPITGGAYSDTSGYWVIGSGTAACNLADIVSVGQLPPPDGLLTGDDYVAFINAFFTGNLLADVVSVGQQPPPDGLLTGDDYVAFINAFFIGCH